MSFKSYIWSFDPGIGSVGWAVMSYEKDNLFSHKIEDANVRIFSSGEIPYKNERKSQKRGVYRRLRRQNARKKQRLERLSKKMKQIFPEDNIPINPDSNIWRYRFNGLVQPLTVEQLFYVLRHAAIHRGYRMDFADVDEDESTEEKDFKQKMNLLREEFLQSQYTHFSEFLIMNYRKDDGELAFRNTPNSQKATVIFEEDNQKEIWAILKRQQCFYSTLTNQDVEEIMKIIFEHRDFEDGPGDTNDEYRKYKGYDGTSNGNCTFYPELKRGQRRSVIGDIYTLINELSQFKYVDNDNNPVELTSNCVNDIVEYVLENAKFSYTVLTPILKQYGVSIVFTSSKKNDIENQKKKLNSVLKYIPLLQVAISKAGEEWTDYIREQQFDYDNPSRLHVISEVLAKCITPRRRIAALSKLEFLSDELVQQLSRIKASGTANCSNRYMCETIRAAMEGVKYGYYQAECINSCMTDNQTIEKFKLQVSNLDETIKNNPVVMRSISECYKIINNLYTRYGAPEEIVLEIGKELSQSFDTREKRKAEQQKNQKENERINRAIGELLGIDFTQVTRKQREMYRLYEQQSGQSIYSGKTLGEIKQVVLNKNYAYEIDHIIPISWIGDDTLENKVLVFAEENHKKGAHIPLYFLNGSEKLLFKQRVNAMFLASDNTISKKKYQYLLMEEEDSPEMKELIRSWKTRNLNDTRYIARELKLKLEQAFYLAGEDVKVTCIRGAHTSRFRNMWLRGTSFARKDRNNFLNHTVDAIILANLTSTGLDLAYKGIELRQLKYEKLSESAYFNNLLAKCIAKIQKRYGGTKEEIRELLEKNNYQYTFLHDIAKEVEIRCPQDNDEKKFKRNIIAFYGDNSNFDVEPHIPVMSLKTDRKLSRPICDSITCRIVERNGEYYKITKKDIKKVTYKDLKRLATNDMDLIQSLNSCLVEEGDTVGKYMKESGKELFETKRGNIFRQVSTYVKAPRFFKKIIGKNNYSCYTGIEYYCIEIYKDNKRNTRVWGISVMDLVKKHGKLYLRKESLPEDYCTHVMYVYHNEYLEIFDKRGNLSFEGYFRSVFAISEPSFRYYKNNRREESSNKRIKIHKTDKVKKREITILGEKGGYVKSLEPFSLI